MNYLKMRNLSRRRFLGAVAATGAASLTVGSRALAQGEAPLLINSIRSLSNPYHALWNAGGEAFARSVGLDYVTLVTEGDSEKGVADIRAILARTGGNAVVNVDPNDAPDARPIVEACVEAGAHVFTQWNKPADFHPWDIGDNYVAHMSYNGEQYGKATAEVLIDTMGGQGGILGAVNGQGACQAVASFNAQGVHAVHSPPTRWYRRNDVFSMPHEREKDTWETAGESYVPSVGGDPDGDSRNAPFCILFQ